MCSGSQDLFTSFPNEYSYRETQYEGGVDWIPLVTLSQELEETPDMYIFSKSSDVALSRGTHFSYATSPELGATCPQTFCLNLHHSKLIGARALKKYGFWWFMTCRSVQGRDSIGKVLLARKSFVSAFQKYIHVGGFLQPPRKCDHEKSITPPSSRSLNNCVHIFMTTTITMY